MSEAPERITHHDISNHAVHEAILDANRKALEMFSRITALEHLLHPILRGNVLRNWTPDLGIIDGEQAEIVELRILARRLDWVLAQLEHLQYRATPLDAA